MAEIQKYGKRCEYLAFYQHTPIVKVKKKNSIFKTSLEISQKFEMVNKLNCIIENNSIHVRM